MNKMNPLFSILIANYNNGFFLPDAINSALSQTYKNFEIIIVDDCSNDNSGILYEQYQDDARIKVFKNAKNQGCGYTKDRCVREASGELCGFLDPDDKLEYNALARMVNEFANKPDIVMAYSNHYVTDESFNLSSIFKGRSLCTGESILTSKSGPVSHFVAFKRNAYILSGGVDICMKRCVDYDMYYRLEEMGPISYVDECLYWYRQNEHSISLGKNVYSASAWQIYSCVNAMKRRGLEDESLMMFPLERALCTSADVVRNTITFRIGKFITRPVKWFIERRNKK